MEWAASKDYGSISESCSQGDEVMHGVRDLGIKGVGAVTG